MHDRLNQSLPDFITQDTARQAWMETHVQPHRENLLRWVQDHDDWHGFAGQYGARALVARDVMLTHLGGQAEDAPPRREQSEAMLAALTAAPFPSRDPEDCPPETKQALTVLLYDALCAELAKPLPSPEKTPWLSGKKLLYWAFQTALILLVVHLVSAWLS
jgi:hypothetical protein